jgi:hypothetical protein
MGKIATPIMKGELNRPRADPTLLSILSNLESVNEERMIIQNGINVSATTDKVNMNIFEDIEFASPFLAIIAPKSLK